MKFEQTKSDYELDEALEPELRAVLADFRQSMDAWSQASISRPRAVIAPKHVWRKTLGWALGCALVAGGLTAGFWNHTRSSAVEQVRTPLQRRPVIADPLPEQKIRPAAQSEARPEEEQLMASVDSDVARQVPSAMEPLAQLMAGDEETR
jgi:hypothetical protein